MEKITLKEKYNWNFLICLMCVLTSNAQISFTDVTEEAGIAHQFKVYEGTFGGGAAVFDINNDGFQDVFITSGTRTDVLYLNNGDGTFKNIYETSGLSISKNYVTQGAVSADVNKDGWNDLFITTINTTDSSSVIPRAKNLLFLNNGDLSFRDVTKEYGLENLNSFSTGASFGDINEDGYPDLYVGNYFLEFEGKLGIIKDATIVSANQTAKGYLLINKEGKYFENQYEDYGMDHRGFGFGALFTDYDNDGDQDVLVNHDFGYKAVPNLFYENKHPRRTLNEVGEDIAMDLKINAMGSAVGDYNNDGDLDYFITNIKFNFFMENQGSGKLFLDKAKELGVHNLSISWGANFADFDQDGDLDLFISNGDLNPNCVPMSNYYYENKNGLFLDKSRAVGLNDYGIGRGSVVFDIENDGDLDILVVNQEPILANYPTSSITRLFRNESKKGNWLKVKLKGVASETNGIGARVEVVTEDIHMIREIDGGGSSHLSQNSSIAHFGLGDISTVNKVIITWVGGNKQTITNPTVNTLIEVVEVESVGNGLYIVIIIVLSFLLLLFFYKKNKKEA